MQRIKHAEREEVEQLQGEIEKEKTDKVKARIKELETARKIIKENEIKKREKQKQADKEKMEQIRLDEQYNKLLDEQEKKRAEEMAKREEKIQKIMNRMPDVSKKGRELEMLEDKRIL